MREGAVAVIANFRRRMVVRLATTGMVVALAAGVAAYFIGTERLDETLVDEAALEARWLSALVSQNLDSGTVAQTLHEVIDNRATRHRDFFILAELYDTRRQPLGDAFAAGHESAGEQFNRSRHQFPALGGTWYEKTILDGDVYLQVMVPLTAEDGAAAGWFEGIFYLSPETTAALRSDILRIIGLVVLAVLATAGMLYPIITPLQRHLITAAHDLIHANLDTLKVLGNAIAKRDSDTNEHNYRVTIYTVRIAERIGLSADRIRSLIKGAFLHDVGKIAVPDAILLKPGKLDEREMAEMKTHVRHGLDIIGANDWLLDAQEVVGGHHEKFDGGGYPAGLAGDAIPLAARIFAVADVFDALTSVRPYKKAFPLAEAVTILEQGRGRHFDAAVLDAFNALMPHLFEAIAACDNAAIEAMADDLLATYFSFD
jgi:HD-GYP domain-containing protein (c-di-GMP phosphodiesterase class II)